MTTPQVARLPAHESRNNVAVASGAEVQVVFLIVNAVLDKSFTRSYPVLDNHRHFLAVPLQRMPPADRVELVAQTAKVWVRAALLTGSAQ